MLSRTMSKLTEAQRLAWKQYFHMYDLGDYSYRTQMKAFYDFCSENNINL